MRQLALGVGLRERASFANYHPAAAPEAVAQLRGICVGQPGIVWLHGPSGVGKSHLLQALCNETASDLRVGLFPLRDLLAQGQDVTLTAKLAGWETLSLCCIDDVDLAVDSEALERALFSLYRETDERKAALVVTAELAPSSLNWKLPDIGSRFGAAQIYRLRELSEVEQGEALVKRAALRGLHLPEETLSYLQRRMPRDMRSLCAVLDTLDAASLVEQRRITVPFIRQVLDAKLLTS